DGSRQPLRGLRALHRFSIFTEPRLAVAPGTMMKCLLRSSNVCCLAFPSLKHGSLQSTSVGKAQLPRQSLHPIHRIEMFRSLLIGLATGEKPKALCGSGHHAFHATHCGFGHFLHRSLLWTFFP